jgi:hypothetical protein
MRISLTRAPVGAARRRVRRRLLALTGCVVLAAAAGLPARVSQPGLTNVAAVAQVYERILDADVDAVAPLLTRTCPPAAAEACVMLQAVALQWQALIDRDDRALASRFADAAERAVKATEAWTRREPQRAEAWFYLGGAYAARAQSRVLRRERLAAARDGKRIKEALERTLALDPSLEDAKFGIGMYRYYADVAPAALRLLRVLLLLPGGNRREGLQQMIEARERGQLLRGEADYQLHLVYLWYENRQHDALALVRALQTRYPHNPLFLLSEAEILDEYFHDRPASLAVATRVLALAQDRAIHLPDAATRRAQTLLARLRSPRR